METGATMRQLLIALLAMGLMAACSDEPEEQTHEHDNATEHTIEQSATQAASGMDAAGEDAEVVSETTGEAGEAMEQAAEETKQAAADAAESVEETAVAAAEQAEEAAEELAGRDPEKLYNTYCVACHAQGVAGAPRLGDTQAWQQRLDARGRDGLVQNSINGYKAMPAKGTCSDCSDEELAATVDWMLSQAGL